MYLTVNPKGSQDMKQLSQLIPIKAPSFTGKISIMWFSTLYRYGSKKQLQVIIHNPNYGLCIIP